MRKVLNFVLPAEETINKINIYNYTQIVNFTYLISNEPQKSADMLFLPVSQINLSTLYPEFKFIPFMIYGNIKFIEKSFLVGCCDFLKDPWSFNELEIRTSRLINRDAIVVNQIVITFTNNFIKSKFRELPLTVNEYKILSVLTNNMDKIISRQSLYYRLGIKNEKSRVIDVYLNSIRSKISKIIPGNEIKIIQTVRGKGYTINSQFACG